jgi:hypothetical protein
MRQVIHGFDAFLARAVGVFEFTQDSTCILRLQQTTLRHGLVLQGTEVLSGAPVLMLHLWNKRVPPLPAQGADLAWARHIAHSLVCSLYLVHDYMVSEPARARVCAVGAVTVLGLASGTADLLAYLGFLPYPYRCPLGRFGEWWENAYTWGLMWAYNPASLRGKKLGQLRRTEYWMSAAGFLDRFAAR